MPTPTQTEKWAAACFEEMNMAVHRARNSTVKRGKIFVAQTNDIFGVYDIIVIDPVTGMVYLYQVTSSYKQASAKRRDVREWVKDYNFHPDAFDWLTVGILVYSSQKSRTDARRKERFFYREHYDGTWSKLEPLMIPEEVK